MTTLDRTDLRLLAVLQSEGRITNAELAERVSLSPSACLRRLQRLEADKVITGYAAQVDPQSVGLGLQAFVRVQLARHEGAAVERFVEQINGWDEVVACHALTGDMDYLLHVCGRPAGLLALPARSPAERRRRGRPQFQFRAAHGEAFAVAAAGADGKPRPGRRFAMTRRPVRPNLARGADVAPNPSPFTISWRVS